MTPRPPPEPVGVIKGRRDAALSDLVERVPYAVFLGVRFDRRGDELTAIMPYAAHLLGNPHIPSLHGGAIAAFLEMAAMIELMWSLIWQDMETQGTMPALRLPKTIDFTVDYLRAGLPRDCYARARINRSGRRFASVQVSAWQDNHARPIAQGSGHFLLSDR